jgi:SAM-dependent methyltransferase
METDPAEFHTVAFWERFYAVRGGTAFEWYGSWADIAPIVLSALGTDDGNGGGGYSPPARPPALVLGCGNSTLSEDMHAQGGFHDVTSIDYSPAVIAEMRAKCQKASPGAQVATGLRWEVMDVTDMAAYADSSWSLVVDKGTLDALYAEDTAVLARAAARMLREVGRVLAPGGVYVLVSMAQGFVLERALTAFCPPSATGMVRPVLCALAARTRTVRMHELYVCGWRNRETRRSRNHSLNSRPRSHPLCPETAPAAARLRFYFVEPGKALPCQPAESGCGCGGRWRVVPPLPSIRHQPPQLLSASPRRWRPWRGTSRGRWRR